jgi:WD40 repeat protein
LLTKGIVQKRNLFSRITNYWDFAGFIGGVLLLFKTPGIDYKFLGLNFIIAHLLYDKVKNIDFTTAIAITPDSRYLLSSSYKNYMQIWNIERNKRIAVLKTYTNLVNALAVSIDGKYFASASNDKVIRVWDLKKRKLLFSLKGHTESVNTVVLTDDNKYLISGSNDKKINIWNLETRKVSFTFSGHFDSINALKFIPRNNQVISVSSDKTLQLWDMQTGNLIAKFTGESSINCCSVSSDGFTIVAGEESGRLHILRLEGRYA